MSAIAETEQAALAAAAREVLTFRLGAEEYGIDILRVQEIRSYETPTVIANAPDFIKGVVNLRGVIVPIVDLRLKFGLEHADYGDTTATVVINVDRRVVGIVVDTVRDVVALTAEQFHAVPQFNARVPAEHITGLATLRDGGAERLLILLDIDRLMHTADMGLFDTAG